MKRLRIDRKYIIRHAAAYRCSLGIALDELANGRKLRFRDMRCKRTLKFLKAKDTDYVRGCGIFYARVVKFLFTKYDILVAQPRELQHCANVLDWVDQTIRNEFPSQRKDYEDSKASIAELFNYARFGAGKRIVVHHDPVQGWYFTWDRMQKWSAWHFMLALDARTCSYCNGDGVFSLLLNSKLPGSSEMAVDVGDTRRSPFDHFYGYADYPCLGLSLFNLVPACTRCNTNIKGAKKQDMYDFIHPYCESFDDGARFYALFERYAAISFPKEDDVCVVLRPPIAVNGDLDLERRAGESSEFFHLEEVYNQVYGRELVDIVRRVVAMPKAYWDDMVRRFPDIEAAIVNRMLMGCSNDRRFINKERLSKLTCDLWDQLHVDILPSIH